jgi:hypothetical protein
MVEFNKDQARIFLSLVFNNKPGLIQIGKLPSWEGETFPTTKTGIQDAVDYAAKLDTNCPKGIYFRATTLQHKPANGRRGGIDDTATVPIFWGDVDFGDIGHEGHNLPPDQTAAERVIHQSGMPEPSILIHSGGGLYPIWMINDSLTVERAGQVSKNVQAVLREAAAANGWHYGTGVGDLARVLRLPGSVNRKAGLERLCEVIATPCHVVDIDKFPRPRPATPQTGPRAPTADVDRLPGAFHRLAEHATWADILEPARWTLIRTEAGGAELWRRPGDPQSEYSARAFEHNLVVHSEAAGLPAGEGQRLTKGRVYAHLWYRGDLSAAGRDLCAGINEGGLPAHVINAVRNGSHPPAIQALAATTSGSTPSHQEPTNARALPNLPAEFWTARPQLELIRQAAHSRGRSADLVLGALLARLSAMVSHKLRFDTGLGVGSLNLFVAGVGPSGVGKSTAAKLARELIDTPWHLMPDDPLSMGVELFRDGLPIGSGEGLAESFMGSAPTNDRKTTKKGRRQIRHNAFIYVDEGEALTKLIERAGSTIGPALRSAWNGEALGQANAADDRTRIIPAGSYSLGLLIGFQRSTAIPLLADVGPGTPQRFLWCSAIDPNVPTEPPDIPPRLHVVFTDSRAEPIEGTITAAKEIRDELWQRNLARVHGQITDDDLDSHTPLMRSKLAALLAVLDGRTSITTEDWSLSQILWETSCAVRDGLVAHARDEEARKHEARTQAGVERREREAAAVGQVPAKLARIANLLVSHITDNDGPLTDGAARKNLASRDRQLYETAIEHAISSGLLRRVGGGIALPATAGGTT